MPHSYHARQVYKTAPARRRLPLISAAVIVGVMLVGYTSFSFLKPLPGATVTITPPVIPAQASVSVPWPAASQAAMGADGYGLLAAHDDDTPRPTASIAKVITALVVLQQKPFKIDEQGPSIPITDADVAIYDKYQANDGSTLAVASGDAISEYQALQALMLPSANNIADTLAIWAFGSLDGYTTAANSYTASLGMTKTHVSDASGFSASTVSTASDLIRLGDAALDNPILRQIVSQPSAVLATVGTVNNVNTLLGRSGIIGIKTGNTDEAGGCFLGAADIVIGDKTITVITAVMKAATLGQALRESLSLIQAAPAEFQQISIVTAGQIVGQVTTPWGGQTDLVARSPITVANWNGTALSAHVSKGAVPATALANTPAGSLLLNFNGAVSTSAVRTRQAIAKPSLWWRLSHPL